MSSFRSIIGLTLFLSLTVSTTQAGDRPYSIPCLDRDDQLYRQVVVDQEHGQYLGHPTTVLLEDGHTILCVYPKGHGKGGIVYKRSVDGGLSWSDRLPVPENWATSREVPTLHRVVGPDGKKRIIMFSGLYPCRMAVTDDDGATWSDLMPVGDWGGISDDEGQTWSKHRDLPASLNGDRHTGKYLSDRRLFISFRSVQPKGLTADHQGDWLAWVGTYDDLAEGKEGQYVVRLKDNKKGADCAYPGVEVLPDDTIVTTTYGHWSVNQMPYILSIRLKLTELDALR